MNGLGNINDFIEENNHGGLIEQDADFYSTNEMPIEENRVVKKVEKVLVWDWKKSIGRALMSGYHTPYIMEKFGLLINQSPQKEKILKYLRVNDGLLGYLFVDTSLFDENFDYSDIPSGMKKYNLYAIHSKNFEKTVRKTVTRNSDGTMDGFLNGDDVIIETYSCQDKYTNLPAIMSMEQVDENAVRRIGKKLLDDGRIGVRDFEIFKNTDKLVFLKKLFRSVTPYIPTNKKTENDVANFGLENQELNSDKISLLKDVTVNNVKEQMLNDVGDISLKKSVEIQNADKPSTKQDVKFMQIEVPEVGRLKETEYDDVGDISLKGTLDVQSGDKFSDKEDVEFIEVEIPLVDNLKEVGYEDVSFEQENKQDIDEGEFFAPDDTNELDIDDAPEDFKISNKGSFDW